MRTGHWVTKIGSLKSSLRFYELVFGFRVLRHEGAPPLLLVLTRSHVPGTEWCTLRPALARIDLIRPPRSPPRV